MTEILYKQLSYEIVGAAMEVHRILGPGYLEAVYQKALEHELSLHGIPYEQQVHLKVAYKGITVGIYKADFLVDDKIVLEIKAISSLTRGDFAQARNYLTATGYRLSILLNFGASSLDHKRVVK